jgi:hypothetical protein
VIYKQGDASRPSERPVVILHVVNDVGAWGRGFTASLDVNVPGARLDFLAWVRGEPGFGQISPYALGWSRLFAVSEDVSVLHVCAQHGLRGRGNPRPFNLLAFDRALSLGIPWQREPFTVVMPKVGCGLGGGDWHDVEMAVSRRLSVFPVVVYSP